MASGPLLRGTPARAWAEWHHRKVPDEELRTLLDAVRGDAGAPSVRPVTDDYFLAPDRRDRIQRLEDWTRRLSDRRLRHLVEDVVGSSLECWSKTKPPAVTDQDARWTVWQSAAAREWLSATKAALDRLAALERRWERAVDRVGAR